MAHPYSQIKRKVEDAFAELISDRQDDNLAGVVIFKGLSYVTELTAPRVEVLADVAAPEIIGEKVTGNYRVQVRIALVQNYKDEIRASRALKDSELFDILYLQDIEIQLNNTDVPDFHAYGGDIGEGEGWEPGQVTTLIDGHEVKEELVGVIYCRPSSLE